LDLALILILLVLVVAAALLALLVGFNFFDLFGFLNISYDLAVDVAWSWAWSGLTAAHLVSWVVQGLSVILAASESNGWVNVVDGSGAASLVVNINLGGSTAASLNVGVVVVDGDILGDVNHYTAWA